MTLVIGVNFNDSKKIYYFSVGDESLKKGEYAVVETERGLQCAKVVTNVIDIDPAKLTSALKPVVLVLAILLLITLRLLCCVSIPEPTV